MQARTRTWLDSTDFFSLTGLAPENVRFCLERQEKASICRDLNISHFVDDRIHIMQILRHTVPNLYLFGESGGEQYCPPWATFVSGWPQLVDLVTESIEQK